jgi:hypothetical protein
MLKGHPRAVEPAAADIRLSLRGRETAAGSSRKSAGKRRCYAKSLDLCAFIYGKMFMSLKK